MKVISALALAALVGIGGAPARAQDATPTPGPDSLTPAQVAAIDAIGHASIDQGGTPSVEIAILRDGQVVYQKGFGLRNVEDAVAPDNGTRYPIGSNTKQFTATSILMLRDQGKLNIDAPLATYLPEIPHGKQVTLRNLLMHTGGYAEFTEQQDFDELGARPTTAAQVVSRSARRPLAFKPGTSRQYSNTGYMLLQMVIERISHQSYADFIRTHIFEPVGMTSSFVRVGDDTSPDVATEYDSFALGPWEHAMHIEYSWFGGAGAIISNAADLSKWNAAHDGGRLLSARSLHDMMTPVKVGQAFPDYGFAIQISKLPNGHRMIYHGGNTTGAATQDARFPDDHLEIIVLANSGFYGYDEAVQAIYAKLVPAPRATPKPAAKPKAPAGPKASPAAIAAAQAWLDHAIAGSIDDAKLRPDFRAWLTPAHRLALRKLAALGPRKYLLVDVDRRAPSTGYIFVVQTHGKQLLYAYGRDDDGSVAAAEVFPHVVFPAP